MPVYVKGDHKVNVSGEEAVAQFEAAGYSPATEKAAEKKADPPTGDKPAAKKSAKKSGK